MLILNLHLKDKKTIILSIYLNVEGSSELNLDTTITFDSFPVPSIAEKLISRIKDCSKLCTKKDKYLKVCMTLFQYPQDPSSHHMIVPVHLQG